MQVGHQQQAARMRQHHLCEGLRFIGTISALLRGSQKAAQASMSLRRFSNWQKLIVW